MTLRAVRLFLPLAFAASLGGCDIVDEMTREADGEEVADQVLTTDPLLARALNDPLLVDPDLSWRSEANAAIFYRDSHPLPPFEATPEAARRAVEAARSELLEDGAIPAMPLPQPGQGAPALGGLGTANAMIEALDARPDCLDRIDGRLEWSTKMPATSSIMPHGMIHQAAGVDEGTCVIRVLRYRSPANAQDVLEYHYAKAERARFSVELFAQPEAQLRAERRDQIIAVHVREGPGAMSEVDVIHWRK